MAVFAGYAGALFGEIPSLLSVGIGGLALALALLAGRLAVWSLRRTDAAAREAKAKEELLVTIVENLGQGVAVVDAELNVVMFNRRFLELLDFPRERFSPGDPLEKFIRHSCERGEYGPGDVEAMLRERMAAARRGEPCHSERTRPDGTALEIRREKLPSGGFVTTYRDVTAERRTQAALEASEQRTRTVLDQALDAVVTMEPTSASSASTPPPRPSSAGRATRLWAGVFRTC